MLHLLSVRVLLFPIVLVTLLLGLEGAFATEGSSSLSNEKAPDTAKQEFRELSKRTPAGKMKRHHPGHPVQLPSTTGPIVTDDGITQPYKTWSAQITPSLTFVGGVFNSIGSGEAPGPTNPTGNCKLVIRGITNP